METRALRTCEMKGTIIEHKEVKTLCKIVGSYIGGFFVSDLNYKCPFPLKLPFRNISQWDVLEAI